MGPRRPSQGWLQDNGVTPDLVAGFAGIHKIGSRIMDDKDNSTLSTPQKTILDDDYDDTIEIPKSRIPRSVLDYSFGAKVSREWVKDNPPPEAASIDRLRLSRRFSAYGRLVLRAGERVRRYPVERCNEADGLQGIADDHSELWEYYTEDIERLIAWIRAGAPKPRPAKLSPEQRALRAAAVARQRARHGR